MERPQILPQRLPNALPTRAPVLGTYRSIELLNKAPETP